MKSTNKPDKEEPKPKTELPPSKFELFGGLSYRMQPLSKEYLKLMLDIVERLVGKHKELYAQELRLAIAKDPEALQAASVAARAEKRKNGTGHSTPPIPPPPTGK